MVLLKYTKRKTKIYTELVGVNSGRRSTAIPMGFKRSNEVKKNIIFLVTSTLLIILGILFYMNGSNNDVLETTTEQIKVISKHKSSEEHWIILANDKKVFIENFSNWALIEENESYTIVYDLMEDTEKNYLRTIVPDDYNGQF